MKLRDKKTGEISEFNEIYLTKTVKETNTATSEYVERAFYSISDLQDEFEDYKPTEPLIKDEKIRKAVRAWAEANNVDKVEYNYYPADDNCSFIFTYDDDLELLLDFRCKIDNLTPYKTYAIPELIGGEEE